MDLSALTISLPRVADPLGAWSLDNPFDCDPLRVFYNHRLIRALRRSSSYFEHSASIYHTSAEVVGVARKLGHIWQVGSKGQLGVMHNGNRGILFVSMGRSGPRGEWLLVPQSITLNPEGDYTDRRAARAEVADILRQALMSQYPGRPGQPPSSPEDGIKTFIPGGFHNQEPFLEKGKGRTPRALEPLYDALCLLPLRAGFHLHLTAVRPGQNGWMMPELEALHRAQILRDENAACLDAARAIWADLRDEACASLLPHQLVRYGLDRNKTVAKSLYTLFTPHQDGITHHQRLSLMARLSPTTRRLIENLNG